MPALGVDWLEQRACQFGDGLFETMAVRNGGICLWHAHAARLTKGCGRIGLPMPPVDRLAAEGAGLVRGVQRGVLKLFWTAGASQRGYRRPTPVHAVHRFQPGDCPYPHPPGPWRLRLCHYRLGENPVLAGIKHLNRLDQVMARAEWDDPAIHEGVVLGQDGRVISGTMTNLFVQHGARLLTPSIDRAGIAGVVRGLALDIASLGAASDIEVGDLDLAALQRADAIYLTNSLVGVVRVASFEAVAYDLSLAEHPLMRETRRLCHDPGHGCS